MDVGATVRVRAGRRRFRRRLRRALLAGLVAGCLLVLSGGWLTLRGWEARGRLISAADLAGDLSDQVVAGQTDEARRTLAALTQQVAGAHDITTGPAWWTAAQTPYLGRDISAVRDVAACVDDLARHAFPALLGLNPSALLPAGGRLDLVALRDAAPALASADAVVQDVRARLGTVPTGLLPQVRTSVERFRAQVGRLATLTSAAHRATTLLPTLLGADGPRTYLLLLQNLAEARSTGGIFGAYAVLRADHGLLSMTSRGAGGDLSAFDQPVLPVDAATRALYTDRIGTFPADVNLTPDFPDAAKMFREMYRRRTGVGVDGVLATDPVALSYLLRATGPVPMPDAPTLDSDTAVHTLLSQPYRDIASDSQRHDYFASALGAVFDAVMHRPVNPRALLDALDRATAEHRILVWSAEANQQAAFAGTSMAGILPERESAPSVGVFLNDGSGAKLDYYLTHSATLTAGDCRSDGRRELDLRLTLGSSAPNSGLTPAVLGLGLAGDPYTARTLVYLFSPVRGSLVAARLDGAPAPLGSGSQGGRQVGVIAVDLAPGRQHVLDVRVLAPTKATGPAQLWLTPGVAPWITHINPAPTCAQ